MDEETPLAVIEVPEDLSTLSDDALAALDEQLAARFAELYGDGQNVPTEVLAQLAQLKADSDRVRGEYAERVATAEQNAAEAAELARAVLGDGDETADDTVAEQQADQPDDEAEDASEGDEAEEEPEPEEDRVLATVAADRPRIPAQPRAYPRINLSLAERRARAPRPRPTEQHDRAVVTAAADVPGFNHESRLPTVLDVATAMHARARNLPVTAVGPEYANYLDVAVLQNEFPVVIDGDRTPEADVWEMLQANGRQEALTAAGGWCAPSEVRYDFFDVACQDGGIDLPTFGVRRGGIRFPVSPTLADVFTGAFNVTTNPWLWTETDDIATVTGGPNKPCVRVPCPSFTDVRLECYGICLTAGNLTDDAFPEATAHQLGLLEAAMFHASNARYIGQIITGSTVVSGGALDDGGNGTAAPLLGAVELAAIDFRTRFGMCDDDILEVVLPFWARGVLRSDLAKRSGVDLLAVSDARLNDHFDVRKVRVQYVADWQVRTAGLPGGATALTAWPTTIEFLIYPAGAIQRGNGMTLRLGVVRDSVLNAENDHTAAWMEECHLIATFGPAPRRYQVVICTDGTTGASDLTACGV